MKINALILIFIFSFSASHAKTETTLKFVDSKEHRAIANVLISVENQVIAVSDADGIIRLPTEKTQFDYITAFSFRHESLEINLQEVYSQNENVFFLNKLRQSQTNSLTELSPYLIIQNSIKNMRDKINCKKQVKVKYFQNDYLYSNGNLTNEELIEKEVVALLNNNCKLILRDKGLKNVRQRINALLKSNPVHYSIYNVFRKPSEYNFEIINTYNNPLQNKDYIEIVALNKDTTLFSCENNFIIEYPELKLLTFSVVKTYKKESKNKISEPKYQIIYCPLNMLPLYIENYYIYSNENFEHKKNTTVILNYLKNETEIKNNY